MLSLKSIPVKNLRAHPARTLILLMLALAQAACVFSGMMTVQGMRQELALAEARLGADVLVYPTAAASKISMDSLLMQGTPVEVYKDRSILSRMDSSDDIDAVTHQIYIKDTTEDGREIWITGFEPETDFVLSPWLEEGNITEIPAGSVVAGSKVELSGGQTVTLYQKQWPAAYRLAETGSPLDETVFVPMDTMDDMIGAAEQAGIEKYSSVDPGSDFSAALVRVKNKEKVGSVADWINIYVRKVTTVRSEESLTQAASGIRGSTKTMAAVAVLAWIVLLAALGIIQSILMKERIKEMYVWHAAGASRSIVSRVLMTESFLVHTAGAAAGALLAGLVFLLLGGRILSGITPPAGSMIIAAVLSVVIAAAAGLVFTYISIRKAAKKLNGQMLLTV